MTVPQLPLALRYPPEQRLDTYVLPPDGAVAQLHALATVAQSDWLFLSGPSGVGKRHLALAVCADADANGRRAAYLSLKTALGRVAEALDGLEANDVVALDDLDAIAGHRDDEVALFDFHNRARSSGAGVLYASQSSPDALPLVLPDLRSRLSQCTRIVLQPLDDAGRGEVLRQRAQRRGLQLEDAAIDWLLKRVDRDLASLTMCLDKLDRASLAAQRRITVPFLRQILGAEADL